MRQDDRILRETRCCAGSSSPFSCLRSSSSGAFPATPRTTGPGRSRPTCRRSSWAPATAPVRTSSRARLSHRAGTPSRPASSRPRSSPRSFSSSRSSTGTGSTTATAPFWAAFAFYGWVIVYGAAPFVVGGLWLRNQRTDPKRPEPGEPIVSAGVRLAARMTGRSARRDCAGAPALAEPGSRSRAVGADARDHAGARRVRRAGGVRCAARLARRALGLVAASPAGVPRRDGAPARRRGAGVGGDRDGPRLGVDLPRRSRRDGPRDPRPLSEDGELGCAAPAAPAAGT